MSVYSDALFAALSPSADTLQNQKETLANYSLVEGVKMLQKKRPADAIPYFQRAIKINPDSVDAYNNLGNTYLQMSKNDEAIATFKKLAAIKVTNPDVQISLGNAYSQAKKWTEASQAYKRAIVFDPVNLTAHYSLGQTYMLQGKLKEAETEFKLVTRISPRDSSGYYALGQVYNKMESYDSAITNLKKATSLKRNFNSAELELGYSYIGKKDDFMVQEQINRLTALNDSTSATELQNAAAKPKITRIDYSGRNPFYPQLGPYVPLGMLTASDPNQTLSKPNASKDFTIVFHFDTDMDVKSIQNPINWNIGKARGGKAGYYNNGYTLNPQKDTVVLPFPKQVTYDVKNRNATVTFTLKQNANANGEIDPKHLVFKFSGKDVNGRAMDPTADEFDGFAGEAF